MDIGYCSILLLSYYSTSSGAVGSPCLLLPYSVISQSLHNTIILIITRTSIKFQLQITKSTQGMASELRTLAMKTIPNFVDSPENLVRFFIERVRSNLHVVLCMSPVSAKFPERARKFPGIIAGCTIDWFLPWPKEALVAVSTGFISKVELDCSSVVREQLIIHMGMVHKMVVESCEEYFLKMRRHVYQTPKSFLQFLSDYSGMYNSKCNEIDTKASRVEIGLDKLAAGAKDVEKMKIVLAQEEIKLRESEKATNAMLGKLEISSMDAKKEADAVSKIKEACQIDAERISGEKASAEEGKYDEYEDGQVPREFKDRDITLYCWYTISCGECLLDS